MVKNGVIYRRSGGSENGWIRAKNRQVRISSAAANAYDETYWNATVLFNYREKSIEERNGRFVKSLWEFEQRSRKTKSGGFCYI